MMAVLITMAASYESKTLLTVYSVISALIMLLFLALSVQINFLSLVLKQELSGSCISRLMPVIN